MIVPGAGFILFGSGGGGGATCYGCSSEYAFNDTVWEAGTGVTWDTDHFVAPYGTQLEITTASPQCQSEGTVSLQIVVEAVNPSLGGGVGFFSINILDDEDNILEGGSSSWDGIETTFTLNATFPYVTTGKLKIRTDVVGIMATWDYMHITAVTLSCPQPLILVLPTTYPSLTSAGLSSDGGVTFSEITVPTLETGYVWTDAIHNGSEFCILAVNNTSFYTATSVDAVTWVVGSPITQGLTGLMGFGLQYNAALSLYIASERSSSNGIDWS